MDVEFKINLAEEGWETIMIYKERKREKSMKELGKEIVQKIKTGKKIHLVDLGLSIEETKELIVALKEIPPNWLNNLRVTVSTIEWEVKDAKELLEELTSEEQESILAYII